MQRLGTGAESTRRLPYHVIIYREWRRLVTTHGITGLRVHDTRLVAAMLVHGVTHLLTFNEGDFRPYPEIIVVTPNQILRPEAPE